MPKSFRILLGLGVYMAMMSSTAVASTHYCHREGHNVDHADYTVTATELRQERAFEFIYVPGTVTYKSGTGYYPLHEFEPVKIFFVPKPLYVYPKPEPSKLPVKPYLRKKEWKSFHLKE